MLEGTILKGIGGFYYVDTEKGVYECKARGVFRKNRITPLAGDFCVIEEISGDKGNVTEIKSRKNEFIRPPIANIDNMFIVIAAANPDPSAFLVDKLTVLALKQGIKPIIVINKTDIKNADELKTAYGLAGLDVITTSAARGTGAERIKEYLPGKLSVFTGCSGVGKSSLLNLITGENMFETGDISEKIKRGKNTTREVSVVPFCGGFIADTPGFSFLEVTDIKADELEEYFPELAPYPTDCRFRGCSHINEPDCAVKNAVKAGKIGVSRYESYKELYEKLKEIKEWQK